MKQNKNEDEEKSTALIDCIFETLMHQKAHPLSAKATCCKNSKKVIIQSSEISNEGDVDVLFPGLFKPNCQLHAMHSAPQQHRDVFAFLFHRLICCCHLKFSNQACSVHSLFKQLMALSLTPIKDACSRLIMDGHDPTSIKVVDVTAVLTKV